MLKMLHLLMIIGSVVVLASGERCYTCDTAPSDEACNSNLNTCLMEKNESCMTVVRKENGVFMIHKSCKQTIACESLMQQNRIYRKELEPFLCFSCCKGDLCNAVTELPLNEMPREKMNVTSALLNTARPFKNNATLTIYQGHDSTRIESRVSEYKQSAPAKKRRQNSIAKYIARKKFRMQKRSVGTPQYSKPWKAVRPKNRYRTTDVQNSEYLNSDILQAPVDQTSAILMNSMPSVNTCGIPRLNGIAVRRLEAWPSGGTWLVNVHDLSSTTTGWTILVIFTAPLPSSCTVSTWAGDLIQDSANRQAFLFVNHPFNGDISGYNEFNVTFILENCPADFSAKTVNVLAGFYNHSLTNGACQWQTTTTTVAPTTTTSLPTNPPFTLPPWFFTTPPTTSNQTTSATTTTTTTTATTTSSPFTFPPWFFTTPPTTSNPTTTSATTTTAATTTSSPFTLPPWFFTTTTSNPTPKTTTAAPTTTGSPFTLPPWFFTTPTTTASTATTTTPTTPTQTNSTLATTAPISACTKSQGGYTLLGPAYPSISGGLRAHAYVAITSPILSKKDWAIKLVFGVPVEAILCWEVKVTERSADGLTFVLRPMPWFDVLFHRLYFDVIVSTNSTTVPIAEVFYCENTVVPPLGSTTQPAFTSTTALPRSTTTISSTVASTTTPAVPRCSGPRGILPPISRPTVVSFTPSPMSDNLKYDYNEVLHKSILFYEAQRSGPLPANNRVLWRGDSNVHDGCLAGVDLTGGWHDGGDNVKYGFPMAATATVLAWGMIEFADGYKDANEWTNALDMLKWATDYFLKAHTGETEFWGQVGDPLIDQNSWTRPEELTTPRTAYVLNQTSPGSDLVAETAAALAASAIVFNATDPTYASTLVQHAVQLYTFADKYRESYELSIPNTGRFYPSLTGYGDELTWAALWLYLATGDAAYLADAQSKVREFSLLKRPYNFSWDSKLAGIQVLLATITNTTRSRGDVENFLNHCLTDTSVPRTPGNLAFFSNLGTNGYAANAAFIALVAVAKIRPPLPHTQEYFSFAREQIHAILGDGDGGRSYVVGFGTNPPDQPYHAASSCPTWTSPFPPVCDGNAFTSPDPNPHALYGALVSGPNIGGEYKYSRKDFVNNEISINSNAGFQSAIAGLKYFTVKMRMP